MYFLVFHDSNSIVLGRKSLLAPMYFLPCVFICFKTKIAVIDTTCVLFLDITSGSEHAALVHSEGIPPADDDRHVHVLLRRRLPPFHPHRVSR